MSRINPHIIGKQFLHIEIPTAQQSFQLQEKLSKIYWEKMTKILEALFDKFSHTDELIRIDRLDIDLGNFKLSELDEKLPQKLLSALEEILVNQIVQSKKTVDKISLPESHFEKWIYFLQKGILPWNAKNNQESERLKTVLDTLGTHSHAVERLRKLVQTNTKVLRRLIYQHNDDFLKTIIELYTSKSQTELLAVKKEFDRFFEENKDSVFLKKEILEDGMNSSSLLLFWQPIFQKVFIGKSKSQWQELIREVLVSIRTDHHFKFEAKNFLKLKEAVKFKPANQTKNDTPIESTKEAPILKESISTEELDSCYIQNAGIVLVSSFLPVFFSKLELVQGENFKNDAAQQKAIQLIQFLATQETGLPEYDLILPKLLCGLPIDIPIEREIPIGDVEKEEAEKLLKAVIQHWKALGDVSTDSLREGFLIRGGKLQKRQNGWYVIMEKNALDILIDKLPWNISMIKLPWMPNILRVEWIF